MEKSIDAQYIFDTVILVLNRLDSNVENYIRTSASEGLSVGLYVRGDGAFGDTEVLPRAVYEMVGENGNAEGILAITDDCGAAGELKRLGVAVAGYAAPGAGSTFFPLEFVVEELSMVDDEYFNLVYMRAHGIPLLIVRTERTSIREMTVDDLPAMYELYADPAVAQWVEPLYEYERELEFTRAYIENMYGFYGYGLWLVFDRAGGELIGRAGISLREIDGRQCCELGYIIKGSRQRQGIGYEVCRAIMAYAWEQLCLDELWLCVEPENAASLALAEKLGFVWQGRSVYDDGRGEEKECFMYKKKLAP